MSPEQAKLNALDIDTRSDIYALGVLLYELLTGTTPLDRKRLADTALLDVLRVIREEEPPQPSRRLSTVEELPSIAANRGVEPKQLSGVVRGELDWIVMKCLEKDRSRRYETANGLARDLERYLHDEPVQACPPSTGYRLRKFLRRHRVPALAAAVVLLALLASVVSTAIGLVRAERAERAAAVQYEARRQGMLTAIAEARRLQEEERWPQARAVLAQALAQLSDDASEDLRQPLEQARRDLELVVRLDTIRQRLAATVAGKQDLAALRRDFAAAFREAQLMTQDGDEAAAVAARVQASPVRAALVAALDTWAYITADEPRRGWLLEVARRSDPDPVRNRVRDLALWKDARALAQVAGEVDVEKASPELLVLLANLLRKAGGDPVPFLKAAQLAHPSDFRVNWQLGYAFWLAKKPAEAVACFQAALAARPDSNFTYMDLGLVLVEAGRAADAVAVLQKAIELDPTYARPHYNLGLALGQLAKRDDAIAAYKRAIQLDPEYATARVNLGVLLEEKGQVDEAIALYRKAVESDPELPNAPSALAKALKSRGRTEEAIAVLTKPIRRMPTNERLRQVRVTCYVAQQRWREAADDLAQLCRHHPDNAETWYHCGVAHLAARDMDGYRRACAGMLARFGKPERPGEANWAVWTCVLARGAVADLSPLQQLEDQVVARDPRNWYILVAQGALRFRAGRYEEAVRQQTESCAVHPRGGNAYDWFFLAMAHHHLGHTEEARRWLEKATRWLATATQRDIQDTRTPTPLAWNDQVCLDVLRREAEELMQQDTKGKRPMLEKKQELD
jgi:serine/threonine-protein kinase